MSFFSKISDTFKNIRDKRDEFLNRPIFKEPIQDSRTERPLDNFREQRDNLLGASLFKKQAVVPENPIAGTTISQGPERSFFERLRDTSLGRSVFGVTPSERPVNITGGDNRLRASIAQRGSFGSLSELAPFASFIRSTDEKKFQLERDLVEEGIERGRAAEIASARFSPELAGPAYIENGKLVDPKDEIYKKLTEEEEATLKKSTRFLAFENVLDSLDFVPVFGTLASEGAEAFVKKLTKETDVSTIKELIKKNLPTLGGKDSDELARVVQSIDDEGKVAEAMASAINRASSREQFRSQLLDEAQKYDSADEFVKAQGTPVYRATDKPFDVKLLDENGLFVSPKKSVAERYLEGGKIIDELVIDKNAKVLSYKDTPKRFYDIDEGYAIPKDNGDGIEIAKYAKANGYDVVEYGVDPQGLVPESAIVNPNVVKTRSQLEDIWEEANKRSDASELKIVDDILSSVGETEKKPLKQRLTELTDRFTNRFISQYSSLSRAESDILKLADINRERSITIGQLFEQNHAIRDIAARDVDAFKNRIIKPLQGNERNFERYLVARRLLNRAIFKPDKRKVAGIGVERANAMLQALRKEIGDDAYMLVKNIAENDYQEVMDDALKLQKNAGIISERQYKDIKADNDFYAPFDVLEKDGKIIIDNEYDGTGSPTIAAISGMDTEDFKIRSPLERSMELIYMARVRARTNNLMGEVGRLADVVENDIIKRVREGTNRAPKGRDLIEYRVDGKVAKLEVDSDIARALASGNARTNDLLFKVARLGSTPLRWGATIYNAGFQVVNTVADVSRQAVMSRYGINSAMDVVQYPLDYAYALWSSFSGNVLGKQNKLFKAELLIGASNSTYTRVINQSVEAETLTRAARLSKGAVQKGKIVGDTVQGLANVLEQTTKLMTTRRGLRAEGINLDDINIETLTAGLKYDKKGRLTTKSELEYLNKLYRVAYDVRRFGGSPDFGRFGLHTKNLNAIMMFLNARIQAITTDFGRLIGGVPGDKKLTNAIRLRFGAMVGIPTIYIMASMMSDPAVYDDYKKLNSREREDNFMLPTDRFFTDENGQQQREFIRLPKRGPMKMANIIEATMQAIYEEDPNAARGLMYSIVEELSPVNFQLGEGMNRFVQSSFSGFNPLIKVPAENAFNVNFYFGSPIVPDYIEGERSDMLPEELQYKEQTPEAYRALGAFINLSPLKIEHALRGFTGGGLNQFIRKEPLEGRSSLTENQFTKRFFASRYRDDSGNTDIIEQAAKAQAVENVTYSRMAKTAIEEMDALPTSERRGYLREIELRDPKLAQEIISEVEKRERGLSYAERQLLQLNVRNGARAKAIVEILDSYETGSERKAYVEELVKKGVISDTVLEQIIYLVERE